MQLLVPVFEACEASPKRRDWHLKRSPCGFDSRKEGWDPPLVDGNSEPARAGPGHVIKQLIEARDLRRLQGLISSSGAFDAAERGGAQSEPASERRHYA